MAGDNLAEIIDSARRELPEVPDHIWQRLDAIIRRDYGAQRIYVAAHKKRRHLETLAEAGEAADAHRLAEILGVTVRRVRQLKELK